MGFRAEIILRIQSIIFSCEAASRAAVRGRSVVERASVDPVVDHEQLFDGQRRFVFWHDGQVEHLKHRRVFGITRTDVCAPRRRSRALARKIIAERGRAFEMALRATAVRRDDRIVNRGEGGGRSAPVAASAARVSAASAQAGSSAANAGCASDTRSAGSVRVATIRAAALSEVERRASVRRPRNSGLICRTSGGAPSRRVVSAHSTLIGWRAAVAAAVIAAAGEECQKGRNAKRV